MPKSVFSSEYATFLRKLREAREHAGMTQIELGAKLRITQSNVSKCERGERRIDIVELWRWCHVLGVSLRDFAGELERAFGGLPSKGRRGGG